MDIHPQISNSQGYQEFVQANKFAADCINFTHLDFALLSIIGSVDAPNPGAHPRLEFAEPQGWNCKDLLLNLVFDQEPGIWNQVVTPKTVGFSMILPDCDVYDQVTIVGIDTVDIKKTKI